MTILRDLCSPPRGAREVRVRSQPAVHERGRDRRHDVDEEREPHHRGDVPVVRLGDPLGQRRRERAGRRRERREHVVDREPVRTLLHIGEIGHHRLLGREEQADVAARRVQRADEPDDDERPELRDRREADAGERHQRARCEQHPLRAPTVQPQPGPERERGRAEQRGGDDDTDLEAAEAEVLQVTGEQDRREPVGERPDRARDDDADESRAQARRIVEPGTGPALCRGARSHRPVLASAGRAERPSVPVGPARHPRFGRVARHREDLVHLRPTGLEVDRRGGHVELPDPRPAGTDELDRPVPVRAEVRDPRRAGSARSARAGSRRAGPRTATAACATRRRPPRAAGRRGTRSG